MANVSLHLGDCLAVLPTLEANSVHSIVTDPPYGLRFMGKHWDHGIPGEAFWREMLRVAKPGAHLLAFGGTRTHHRLMVAIEDAGWEIRDCLMWIYGSGFPKSHDVSKAIDKAAGAEREVVGDKLDRPGYHLNGHADTGKYGHGVGGSTPETRLRAAQVTAPATEAARQWDGWGTALKPAYEPIILARKPFDGTIAQNVLAHGTGGINIDACRVATNWDTDPTRRGWQGTAISKSHVGFNGISGVKNQNPQGRWPANVIHDGSDEVVRLFPASVARSSMRGERSGSIYGNGKGPTGPDTLRGHDDTGSAARFFYCAKASKCDRDEGLEGRNSHPTVKPTDLCRWLVRLITPPNGTILDPFCGSGSTGKAAMLEGFRFVGIELEPEYLEIAERRIDAARMQMPLLEPAHVA